MLKIKICGITNLKDALTAIKESADTLGFIFYKKSPRYINPQKAKKIIEKLPSRINKVGVFVNEKERLVKKIVRNCKLNILQFHGNESPSYCQRFRDYKVIKAFRIKNRNSLKDIPKYKVDYYLLDTYQKNKIGGTGETFDWELIKLVKKIKKPIILSGGLNPNNITKAIKKTKPNAIDLSSGVEKYPGKKDSGLLKKLFKKIKFFTKNDR
ncbi:MAG: phosphoribosylanthranilate isomerase [Candidatus Omnitrophota bacterium]